MTKPISPRIHGLLDYALAASNLVAPKLLGVSAKACAVFATFGAVQATVNALTKQPYAVRKVIPFAVHGRIDAVSLPALTVVPLLLGIAKEPRARAYWIGAGALTLVVALLTDWAATGSENESTEELERRLEAIPEPPTTLQTVEPIE